MNELTARYEALKEKVSERWAEFAELMKFVETETEYLTAPASTKFHLCKEGGLLEHSVNVAETLLKLKATLAPEISDESCVVVALLHDLGKVGMPKNPLYLKNPPDSKWKQQRPCVFERPHSEPLSDCSTLSADGRGSTGDCLPRRAICGG